jgi:hypothetical protein
MARGNSSQLGCHQHTRLLGSLNLHGEESGAEWDVGPWLYLAEIAANQPLEQRDCLTPLLSWKEGLPLGTLPFTYLGLPLGLTKPKVEEFLPLISRCERRLISTSNYLSQVGWLQMTNAVFSSLPTFYLCTFKLHSTVIKQIDKFKHYLWRGAD